MRVRSYNPVQVGKDQRDRSGAIIIPARKRAIKDAWGWVDPGGEFCELLEPSEHLHLNMTLILSESPYEQLSRVRNYRSELDFEFLRIQRAIYTAIKVEAHHTSRSKLRDHLFEDNQVAAVVPARCPTVGSRNLWTPLS